MSEPHTNHHHHEQGPPVHRITEAQESHRVEQHSRVLKYTISMSVRLACFLAAFFVHGWLQWVFLAGAIVLPYIAVVIANGGADLTKRQPPAEYFAGDEPQMLTSSATGDGPGPTGSDRDEAAARSAATAPEAADDIAGQFADDDAHGAPGNASANAPKTGTGADAPPAGTRLHYPSDPPGPYPAEAPTTIDGSFVEEPAKPEDPVGGHHHHGGVR